MKSCSLFIVLAVRRWNLIFTDRREYDLKFNEQSEYEFGNALVVKNGNTLVANLIKLVA